MMAMTVVMGMMMLVAVVVPLVVSVVVTVVKNLVLFSDFFSVGGDILSTHGDVFHRLCQSERSEQP